MNNEIKEALENVTRYDDIEDYGKYNAGATMDDLQECINDGWISELTPGTYNGALDKFDRVTELTDNDIIDVIKSELAEDDFIMEALETYYPDDKDIRTQVLDYTVIYNVFTIGKRLYVDMDQIRHTIKVKPCKITAPLIRSCFFCAVF